MRFTEPPDASQMREHLTTRNILQHHVQIAVVLNGGRGGEGNGEGGMRGEEGGGGCDG